MKYSIICVMYPNRLLMIYFPLSGSNLDTSFLAYCPSAISFVEKSEITSQFRFFYDPAFL